MNFGDSVKKAARSAGSLVKRAYGFSDRHAWIQCLVIGVVLNLAVESLSRRSFLKGLAHMVQSPLVFLFNSLVIALVMSVCTIFKRRKALYALFSAVWLGFGIANCVILSMRVTPLEWADLHIVKLNLLQVYLSPVQIIIIVVSVLAALTGIVLLFIKGPKQKEPGRLKNAAATAVFAVILVSSLIGFRSNGVLLAGHVKNLANAYRDYGFNYCFLCSVLDLGIDKPSQYDRGDVTGMVDAVKSAAGENEKVKSADCTDENGRRPNIIFLQLETFFDVNHLSTVKFSEDPIPNFTRLQRDCSSGYLSVPSIGGGTANTEFEVISGMSLDYFGIGEYPYKTILKSERCESLCYNLKNYGYSCHAIHNNIATFYDRNKVFANLGFDTFTSVEYMDVPEYTPTGWAKDKVLTGCITDALDSTEGSDLVYTITVQSHGKYPTDYAEPLPISAYGIEDEDIKTSFEYYINQLSEVDAFIGELLDALSERDERSVVVMYGDHLPSFDISADDLSNGDLFQTEYVIWDNFGIVKEDGNLYSYQLASEVMGRLGFDSGLLTKLHQNFSDDKKYQTYLEVFEYDMLYGERYVYGGKGRFPYDSTDLKMGIKDISIDGVEYDAGTGVVTVTGKNFTKYSRVMINDEEYETVMADPGTLTVADAELSAGDRVAVAQIGEDRRALSVSANYFIGGAAENPTVEEPDSPEVVYKTKGFNVPTAIAVTVAGLAAAAASVCLTVFLLRRKKKS